MADMSRKHSIWLFAARVDDLTKSSKSDAIYSNLISENTPTQLCCIWWLWLLVVNMPHLLKWWSNSSTKYDLPFTQECATSCVAAVAESRLVRVSFWLQNNNNHSNVGVSTRREPIRAKYPPCVPDEGDTVLLRKRCVPAKRRNGHTASSSITGGQSALRYSTRGISKACSLHSPSYIMLD